MNLLSTEIHSERMDPWEERVRIVRTHFEKKGYRVHSGLQFGGELVLYADDPSRVHSDFCVHVVPEHGNLDWRQMQSLVRSMPGLHKTLILAYPRQSENGEYVVDELAMATEHAPFRHKREVKEVGGQRKKARSSGETSTAASEVDAEAAIEIQKESRRLEKYRAETH